MKDEDKKLLTEFLGECWHDEKSSGWGIGMNRPFTTWQDLGDLKEKLTQNMEFFGMGSFLDWVDDKFYSSFDGLGDDNFIDWLLNPKRFCQLVADYLKANT
jgi:hypothetical protein